MKSFYEYLNADENAVLEENNISQKLYQIAKKYNVVFKPNFYVNINKSSGIIEITFVKLMRNGNITFIVKQHMKHIKDKAIDISKVELNGDEIDIDDLRKELDIINNFVDDLKINNINLFDEIQ